MEAAIANAGVMKAKLPPCKAKTGVKILISASEPNLQSHAALQQITLTCFFHLQTNVEFKDGMHLDDWQTISEYGLE